MKKLVIFAFLFLFVQNCTQATVFTEALKTCADYTQDGSISHKGETFNILVTLEKAKNGKCVYKEKIYQNKEYQMLTCNFEKGVMPSIAESMEKYSETYKKELAKNKIFEAKMTTNIDVFQRYLTNPKYCQITHSGSKK